MKSDKREISMNFIIFGKTDIGIEKDKNQDSYLIKRAKSSMGELAFGVLCDGMGGLEQGELASSTVINAFDDWFLNDLPNLINFGFNKELLQQQWTTLIKNLNIKISEYGNSCDISIGTTICAILVTQNNFYCVNVGDSRAYIIDDDYIYQVTKDQSLVQRKIDQGIITEEQANFDPDRSVLLQCIGSSPYVDPDFFEGEVSQNEVFMLCSDGFRHEVLAREIHDSFMPSKLTSIEDMERNAQYLIDLNKQREESDNITTILIRTY